MGHRSRVYCEECRHVPDVLTDRQQEYVNRVAGHVATTGRPPTMAWLAEQMDISRSRVAQLRDAIERRRPGLLGAPTSGSAALTVVPAGPVPAAPAYAAPRGTDGAGDPVTEKDWSPGVVPPVPVAPDAVNPDPMNDPASMGGEFL